MSFDSSLDRIEFAANDTWTLTLPAVTQVEVAGCRLPLNNLRGIFTNSTSLRTEMPFPESSSLTPAPGVIMVLDLEGFQTLQAERLSGRMGIFRAKGVGGRGLGIDFGGGGVAELVVLADRFRIPLESGLHWTGVRPPPEAERVEFVGATRGLDVDCAGDQTGRASLTFINPGGGDKATELATGFSVTDPLLEGPRGALTIGNREVKLYGGGVLQIKSPKAFLLPRLRWTPDPPTLEASLGGRSSDVRLDGEQQVRSVLAELADEPRWTVLAAVLVVALGAIFGKLFEIAIPTK